jgi:hypothetical protein
MGKLPTITRLISEDVPEEQRGWFNKILVSLNSFISTMLALLNKGLNFQDNFDAMVERVEFLGRDLSIATGEPLVIRSTLKGSPIGVIKVKMEDITATGATAITSPIDVEWYFDQSGKINITNISNAVTDGSIKYRLTLLIF